MRHLLAAALFLACPWGPARADPCGDQIAAVAAATKAVPGERSVDFSNFSAGADTNLTLACGTPSSVGAQFKGESPPERYFEVFGKAGEVVTKAPAASLATAARQAREVAARLRHSNVDLPGVRVTCSVTNSAARGPLTLCAAIEHDDRT
ncbi:ABC transporter ATPase [Methylobacterium sp. sgz302541]|uniref:ABC transporter ATPase n=1 Tax=unclassified Methylobacterium TaxID=2615210 RepID=UPI003D33D830